MSIELSEQKRRVAATYNLASAGYDQEAVRFFPLCANRLVELIGLQPGQSRPFSPSLTCLRHASAPTG
jgi:hypothetical protein